MTQDEIIQNPVSFIGAARRLWPIGYGPHGWRAVLGWTGVVLLLLVAYAVVLAWYAAMTLIPVLWIFWGIWTVRRRHFIYEARRYGRPIGGQG